MRGDPQRTINPVPRIVGHMAVYTVHDESMRPVTVYVPFSASSWAEVERTVGFALDTQPKPLPREVF